jgi:hypothetical protein
LHYTYISEGMSDHTAVHRPAKHKRGAQRDARNNNGVSEEGDDKGSGAPQNGAIRLMFAARGGALS